MIMLGIMVSVTIAAKERTQIEAPGSSDEEEAQAADTVEQIVTAFEPVIAAQRRVIAKVWHDRSISKLNLFLLMLLRANGEQAMGQLATLAQVSVPNLTATVGRMEELGLVKRTHATHDRRLVIVRTTAKGRACLEQLESVRRAELRRILRKLSPQEQEMCLSAMQVMARAAEAPGADDG